VTTRHIAIDLGAESGRVMLGTVDGNRLSLSEAHRFPNRPLHAGAELFWDLPKIQEEIRHGLRLVAGEPGPPIASLGVDGWGVDFGLLDAEGQLLVCPRHYRDHRTDGMPDAAFLRVPRVDIFEATGVQFMQINTLYQMLALARDQKDMLDRASTFLMVPDLLHWWLTGTVACEFTNATTTQMYDPRAGGWAASLLQRFGIPTRLFPRIVSPGTHLGPLLPQIQTETGLGPVSVIAPATHDTGSAVAALPLDEEEDTVFISSGTWSIVGVEVATPIVTRGTMEANFTNEGGVGGTFRFCKNVMGLWLLQECRRSWGATTGTDYGTLIQEAASADPFRSLIDPDLPELLNPVDMPAAIVALCARTHQPVPSSPAAMARCILESLALKYRYVIDAIASVRDVRPTTVHIVGGGAQNTLLCEMTADATGCRVIAGPVEATALGNILVQAVAAGVLPSLAAGRRAVRASFSLATYLPATSGVWETAYRRFRSQVIQ